MNEAQLIVSTSVGLRGLAILIFALGVMPLMLKEAMIKDSLRFLRLSIPTMVGFYLILSLGEEYLLTCTIQNCILTPFIIELVIFLTSILNVIIAIILYFIYRKKY